MRILVPVPLNNKLDIPLLQASFFHNKYGAEVTILNVLHEATWFKKWHSPGRIQKHRKMTLKKMKRMVKEYFVDDPIHKYLDFRVATGELVSTILKISEEIQADVIIIKKAKRTNSRQRLFKQENADRLIANSACPVLTISKKPTLEGINKILLPVDITKKTDKKVAWAKSLANRFGAEIHIVSVLNMKLKPVYSLSHQKGERIEEEIRKEGIEAKLVLLDKGDKPLEDTVLDYARIYNPDLLLIMTHQENLLFDTFLGSFASNIIHKAKMPVFSVIPSKESIVKGFLDSFTGKSRS
jgi:nucleotide-binding universal stress UspA family protein